MLDYIDLKDEVAKNKNSIESEKMKKIFSVFVSGEWIENNNECDMEVLINHVNIFKVTITAGFPRTEMQ